MNLWIVGQLIKQGETTTWDFQGVFDTEAQAVAECIDVNYFVAPATLNKPLPRETLDWPGCYYPHREPTP